MIRNYLSWDGWQASDKPWLVLGKGPSFDRRTEFDLSKYRILALNHVGMVPNVPVDLLHVTDMEVIVDIGPQLYTSRAALIMPWHPHERMRPSKQTLGAAARMSPYLVKSAQWGRLYSYNSTVAHKLSTNPLLPVVRVHFFSACAAFNLLAVAGVKEVFTLGIDGGSKYSKHFDRQHCLANGRKSFDDQQAELELTLREHGMTWHKL